MSSAEISSRLERRMMERLDASGTLRSGSSKLRPDIVAWAIVAFWRSEMLQERMASFGVHLKQSQLADGRVPINPEFPEAAWPTPLAILAWRRQGEPGPGLSRAVEFLLRWQGRQYSNLEPGTLGHNTLLRGWPWITGTHSWIEPTALALLALGMVGKSHEARCVQARELILDRQLSHGGWNFGNTTVYGQELRPMPHSTGMALAALACGGVTDDLSASLRYLKDTLPRMRSPLSLAWGIIGLAAWNQPVEQAAVWVDECLDLEAQVGEYDLFLLCLLQCAVLAREYHPLLSGMPV